MDLVDLFIIGGGINGAGIAADAAGRGLSVVLCEQDDLASGTSSKSTKLIHGGLRYLEYFDFKLVRESLIERDILLKKAPHIIWPLQFVMPYAQQLRPAWLIRLGLFLYDHLYGHSQLPRSKSLALTNTRAGKPLKNIFKKGFSYADCYVDDARLVIFNALQAQQLGATILPRTQLIAAQRTHQHWELTLQNKLSGKEFTVTAKALINASGPWVDNVIKNNIHLQLKNQLTLVKGSHFVVPKFYDGEQAYILQNTDKRVVFVIPFHEQFNLIGTTDLAYSGDPKNAAITPEEINYLCDIVNFYFQQPLTAADIIWTYAGVRPLKQEATNELAAISRDYSFELDAATEQAPILNVLGGKITTYRKSSEVALNMLRPFFPTMGPAWTANKPLPGGNMPHANFQAFLQQLKQQYHWLPAALIYRYARTYGTLTSTVLQNVKQLIDMGTDFGCGLYECELNYLLQHEWAYTVEDILWRRTKLGLEFPQSALAKLTKKVQLFKNIKL